MALVQNNPDSMRQEGGGGIIGGGAVQLYDLPHDCISSIISFTSPADACRVAAVSRTLRALAESDLVWDRFLPLEYPSLIPRSSSYLSKKKLYLALCDCPVLVENGRKSFWLEKRTGKKCYMLSARDLTFIWGDTPAYWRWITIPGARFEEVAELISVWWLEIRGKMKTVMLSPETLYLAHLVFKVNETWDGFEDLPLEVGVGTVGNDSAKRTVFIDESEVGDAEYTKEREDRWMEIELGEFYNKGGSENEEIEMSLLEIDSGDWKNGLIVQGIEIRPEDCN